MIMPAFTVTERAFNCKVTRSNSRRSSLCDQHFAEPHEGGALGHRFRLGKTAERPERGSVVQSFGELHIGKIVSDRKQKSPEYRDRRPSRFPFPDL